MNGAINDYAVLVPLNPEIITRKNSNQNCVDNRNGTSPGTSQSRGYHSDMSNRPRICYLKIRVQLQ